MKHIYVLLSGNGNVKIGVSKNVAKRISVIEGASGYRILDYFITEKCSNAFEIEKMAHRYFRDKKLVGEWFRVGFNEAISVVKSLYENYSELFEQKQESDNGKELFNLLFINYPFGEGYEFSDEFIDMAIELGDKMSELKILKEKLRKQTGRERCFPKPL